MLIPQQAERAEQRMPLATHVGLAGCGHVPMSDDPAQVVRMILATTGAMVAWRTALGAGSRMRTNTRSWIDRPESIPRRSYFVTGRRSGRGAKPSVCCTVPDPQPGRQHVLGVVGRVGRGMQDAAGA